MNWHARYAQQAAWTAGLRTYLFERAGLRDGLTLLEVGCGTGAILEGLRAGVQAHGLDLDGQALRQARAHAPRARLTRGDALRLPYADASFSIVCCHFLLLWVADPSVALREMRRVIRRGGHVLALAEPDYSARRDGPPPLDELGRLQTASLRDQGADPALGARLGELFRGAGLEMLECGALDPQPGGSFDERDWELEWAALESDLAGRLPADRLRAYREHDREARESGLRVLHVPTHFALARA